MSLSNTTVTHRVFSASIGSVECKPLLKWPGGKRSELSLIAPRIPPHSRYFEPFFGGGSVYFAHIVAPSYANDINPDLITFYLAVKAKSKQFYSLLTKWVSRWEAVPAYEKERMYYDARNCYNNAPSKSIERAAYFFLIRELAYGGMFRTNAQGNFNVPFGRCYAAGKGLLRRKIEFLTSCSVKRKMQSVSLYNNDFEDFLGSFAFTENDFMFVDPPYDTSFSKYGVHDFDIQDQERLSGLLHSFPGKFMLVCKLTPNIERIFNNGERGGGAYVLHQYECRYRFNIKGRFSRSTSHTLITNYAW